MTDFGQRLRNDSAARTQLERAFCSTLFERLMEKLRRCGGRQYLSPAARQAVALATACNTEMPRVGTADPASVAFIGEMLERITATSPEPTKAELLLAQERLLINGEARVRVFGPMRLI